MKGKMRTNTSGITLIALVITIVLLVVLATISINTIIGSDGLIERAEKVGETYDKAQELERLELVKAEVALESAQKGNGGRYTVEDYVNKLITKGIAVDVPAGGTGEQTQSVVTDRGWLVNISQDGLRNVIFDISKYTGTIPMRITNIGVTASLSNKTIKIEVTAVKAEGAKYTYYYKKETEPDSSYKAVATGITDTTCIIDGKNASTPLEVGTMYTIKVVAEKGSGSSKETDEKTKTAKIEKIQEGLITFTDLTWSSLYDGTASIKINLSNTAPEGTELKYKILDIGDTSDTIGGTLIASGETVTNIQVGKKIIAWIEVGEEKSLPAEINITENVAPNTTITFSKTEIASGGSITATVTLSDNESGIDDTNSKWVLTTENSSLGITDADLSKYTGGTLEGATQSTEEKQKWTKELTISSTTEGTYYLHILTQDRAGNRKETVSTQSITVKAPVQLTSIGIKIIKDGEEDEILEEGEIVTINAGSTIQLGVVYNPGGEEPSEDLKGVNWSMSSDANSYIQYIQLDSTTGRITCLQDIPFETLITVQATSKKDPLITASCKIGCVEYETICLYKDGVDYGLFGGIELIREGDGGDLLEFREDHIYCTTKDACEHLNGLVGTAELIDLEHVVGLEIVSSIPDDGSPYWFGPVFADENNQYVDFLWSQACWEFYYGGVHSGFVMRIKKENATRARAVVCYTNNKASVKEINLLVEKGWSDAVRTAGSSGN